MGDKGNGKEAKWAVERETDIWKWELLRKRNKGIYTKREISFKELVLCLAVELGLRNWAPCGLESRIETSYL